MLRKLEETSTGKSRKDPELARQVQRLRIAEIERELMRLRLAAVETKTRLSRKEERKELDLEIIEAQIKALEEEEDRLLESNPRVVLDLEAGRMEIEIEEEMARKIGLEVERMNVELNSPPRTRLLELATPPTNRRNTLFSDWLARWWKALTG